jgi:hypothetical protein
VAYDCEHDSDNQVITIVWTCLIVATNPSFPASVPFVHFSSTMDSAGSSNSTIKKQEDEEKHDKRDIKPVPKTLNRVPRKLFKNLSSESSF